MVGDEVFQQRFSSCAWIAASTTIIPQPTQYVSSETVMVAWRRRKLEGFSPHLLQQRELSPHYFTERQEHAIYKPLL